VTVQVGVGAGTQCRHRTRLPVRQQSTKIRCPNREPRCAVLPCRDSAVHPNPEPPRGLIRQHRNQHRSRWRRLDPGRQALLALAHLRNGDTYTRLAWGFEISISTAWRYVREAVDLLAAAADDLATAMGRIRQLAYAILDGTLVPIDRVADQKPYYCGKHKRHGVNVQVVADAAGRLVWASAALPGVGSSVAVEGGHPTFVPMAPDTHRCLCANRRSP
jgi:Helix-turn-helix of DDE superfamily endonuclease/DDE superfamily endonuclease